jgi:hypothetical protein
MGRVTNVILTAPVGQPDCLDPEIDSVNKFLGVGTRTMGSSLR